ncbi:hypothetical protein PR048_002994 [Dryococelus australis]|uniref:Uncharacterized protein n=1 Tax=Dryococelus australis TaxID=614101 RepID=A0ABQ9ILS0_9NEOP|nr:hypothetical protein PR048_002994 [Dryococelus australis]
MENRNQDGQTKNRTWVLPNAKRQIKALIVGEASNIANVGEFINPRHVQHMGRNLRSAVSAITLQGHIQVVEHAQSDTSQESLYCDSGSVALHSNKVRGQVKFDTKLWAKITIEEVSTAAKLDTGVQNNFIFFKTVNNQFQVKPTNVNVKTLDDVITPVINFLVSKRVKDNFVLKNNNVFSGLDCFRREHKNIMDEGTPCFASITKGRAKQIREKIVKEVDAQTWISNFVVTEKSNGKDSITLCYGKNPPSNDVSPACLASIGTLGCLALWNSQCNTTLLVFS